jgi:hypothetical protein
MVNACSSLVAFLTLSALLTSTVRVGFASSGGWGVTHMGLDAPVLGLAANLGIGSSWFLSHDRGGSGVCWCRGGCKVTSHELAFIGFNNSVPGGLLSSLTSSFSQRWKVCGVLLEIVLSRHVAKAIELRYLLFRKYKILF